MTEQEKRQHRCCFTGHRPEKLKMAEADVITWLETEIRQTIDDGFVTFISGMARGVDIWAAESVIRLRDEGKAIHLICAIPFEGFERSWPDVWKQRYRDVIQRADIVKYVCKDYNRFCFQIRNEWMVDRCALVLAVFNGESGGTKQTIELAKRKQVPVIISNISEISANTI